MQDRVLHGPHGAKAKAGHELAHHGNGHVRRANVDHGAHTGHQQQDGKRPQRKPPCWKTQNQQRPCRCAHAGAGGKPAHPLATHEQHVSVEERLERVKGAVGKEAQEVEKEEHAQGPVREGHAKALSKLMPKALVGGGLLACCVACALLAHGAWSLRRCPDNRGSEKRRHGDGDKAGLVGGKRGHDTANERPHDDRHRDGGTAEAVHALELARAASEKARIGAHGGATEAVGQALERRDHGKHGIA